MNQRTYGLSSFTREAIGHPIIGEIREAEVTGDGSFRKFSCKCPLNITAVKGTGDSSKVLGSLLSMRLIGLQNKGSNGGI